MCSNDPLQEEYETNVTDAATEAAGARVVKLSAVGAEIGSPLEFWDVHGKIEGDLRASGLQGVLLRSMSYPAPQARSASCFSNPTLTR